MSATLDYPPPLSVDSVETLAHAVEQAGSAAALASALHYDRAKRERLYRALRGEVKRVGHDLVSDAEGYLADLSPEDEATREAARDLGVPYEDAVRPPLHRSYAHLGRDEPEPPPLTNAPPQAPHYAPHLTVTALYDKHGRHFADRVVCVVQHFTPYAAEVDEDGAEREIPTPSRAAPASPPTARTAPASS